MEIIDTGGHVISQKAAEVITRKFHQDEWKEVSMRQPGITDGQILAILKQNEESV